MAMVAQHYEGAPRSLVDQAARRITRLEAAGWRLGTVVVAVSERTDPDAAAARAELVRGLHARLAAAGGGTLMLAVDEQQGARLLRSVDLLASTLDDALDVEIEICVCGTASAEGQRARLAHGLVA